MKKIIFILLTIIWLLTSCNEEKSNFIKKEYSTWTIQIWNIENSKSYIWYTDSFNSVTLWAKVWWKVISISKNIWDRVKIWEILATIDSKEAATWYNSSEDILKSLENLKNTTSQMYDSQINILNEKISQAKTNLEISDIWINWVLAWTNDTKNIINSQVETINSQINTANIWFDTAKLNLENSINNFNLKENEMYSNSKNAISNANILSSNINDFLDNFFWITETNRYKNDSFEIYISAKSTNLKTNIENQFRDIQIKLNEAKNLPTDNNKNLKTALEKYNGLFSNEYRNILKLAYNTLENSISSSDFTQNTINDYKSKISALQSQNEQVILNVSWNYFLWIKWSIDSINSFEKEKKSTLDLLKKQVDLASNQIETLNKSKNQILSTWSWQINDINTKSEISKKQKDLSIKSLNELNASIEALKKQKSSSLAEIEIKINEVIWWKKNSLVMIENAKIISLFNWIITKKYIELWSIVWPWTPIFDISSDDKIKITIQVNDETIKNIHIWEKAQVEIDSVTKPLHWEITKILPTNDIVTKKSSIEISLNNENKEIKLWSYSKVYFNIDKKSNWIIIPNSAIIWNYNIPQILVIENKKAILKNIKIIKQNDNFSQIEWLNNNDVFIINWKENIFDWEKLY